MIKRERKTLSIKEKLSRRSMNRRDYTDGIIHFDDSNLSLLDPLNYIWDHYFIFQTSQGNKCYFCEDCLTIIDSNHKNQLIYHKKTYACDSIYILRLGGQVEFSGFFNYYKGLAKKQAWAMVDDKIIIPGLNTTRCVELYILLKDTSKDEMIVYLSTKINKMNELIEGNHYMIIIEYEDELFIRKEAHAIKVEEQMIDEPQFNNKEDF